MDNGLKVSYETIVENVQRNFGFSEDIKDEEALEWIAAALALANAPAIMEEKVFIEKVCEEPKVKLPNDLHSIIQCGWAEDTYTLAEVRCGIVPLEPMVSSTNTMKSKYHCCDFDDKRMSPGRITYSTSNSYLFLDDFEKGWVVIAYMAIPTDENGYPLIPSEESWRKMLEFEVAYRIAYRMFLRDEITQNKFQLIERDRDWYFTQAVNHSKMPSLDQMESIKNENLRTIPRINYHENFFKNMNLPERRLWRHYRY